MRILLAILLILVAAIGLTTTSCQQHKPSNEPKAKVVNADSNTVRATELADIASAETTVSFKEFNIVIDSFVTVFDEKQPVIKNKDTAYLEADIGQDIGNKELSISTDDFDDIEVEQAFETSMAIGAGWDHCDMVGWKHFQSDWVSIKKIDNGKFILNSHTVEEAKQFPEISIEEFKQAVEKYCGSINHERLIKVKKMDDIPSYISISREFLRVTAVHKNSGKTVTKVIAISFPMGC